MVKIITTIVSITVLSWATAAASVELRMRPLNGMCPIKGATAEEVTILHVFDKTLDKSQIYYSDVFVPCDTLEAIKAGKTENYYPLFVVMGSKVGGKLLPYSTMTIPKLQKQLETALNLRDFSQDAAKITSTFNEMAAAAYQEANFDIKSNEKAIIDVTDRTISVAGTNTVSMGDKTYDETVIATSIIVDGYVATIQGSGIVETAKDFWRLQFMTEWAVREIEVVK